VRSRYAEDQVEAALASEVTQYVILGAGLDTFSYRHRHASSLRIFEVDDPTTQAWKKDLLAGANILIPPSLTFVPLDFEDNELVDGLESNGFRSDRATVFSW
jgi:methyltransferase (TIGR00027 family)